MTSTFTSYALLTRDLDATLARKAAQPDVARETAYYKAKIGSVTSIDEFLADRRLYAYAMKAYGLEDMTYAKAFMRKVLTEGVADSTAFANRLADDRYVAFAKAFDFNTNGAATTTLAAATTDTTAAYLRQSVESDAGSDDTGVRLALYFARVAPTVSSGYGVLGDPALSQVIKTVLGLPDGSSAEGIANQAAIIEKRVDFADFQDPDKLRRFVQRFTAIWDAKNNAASAPILTLFADSTTPGLDASLLLSLQRIRTGS
ncbi:flagellar biosynthesis protein FlgF [Methylobacterium sp. Leaf104]|uniref:DUF1217 domain-containing protein n=1 Tax=Methylobacterium TaxID=407 RepID=UPI0006F6BDAA|nr:MULTISPECIES: DUF1217 domain-containing protein [Methylobacterium]KQP29906.1 flagellar biosynthesis protein FlgF [Methylobacterium sp. Leaf104]MCI9882400.1 DUF1217 domain-containing protein [Methylobacterium goesingense]